jgi:predicted PurR-regulated permease PerM
MLIQFVVCIFIFLVLPLFFSFFPSVVRSFTSLVDQLPAMSDQNKDDTKKEHKASMLQKIKDKTKGVLSQMERKKHRIEAHTLMERARLLQHWADVCLMFCVLYYSFLHFPSSSYF